MKQADTQTRSTLALLCEQRSHLLFVLSEPNPGREADFLQWYRGPYREAVTAISDVLKVRQYKQHEIDITQGKSSRLSFRYLGICELCLDGAEAAKPAIDRIADLHRAHECAAQVATWLYYPVSEKVGHVPAAASSMLTLAFANSLPGQEAEFREWYATRHIRHALHIEALVSGQCFERTQFQIPGAMDAAFSTIAVYEQQGTPADIIAAFSALPPATFAFPTLDLGRFAESVYEPL